MRMYWLVAAVLIPSAFVRGEAPSGRLEGVWQAVEVTHGAPAVTIKPGPNLTIISGRFYSRVDVQTHGPRPVLTNPLTATAEELRQVWGPVVAEAGSFELRDDLIILRPSISKNPTAMAPDVSIIYAYNLDGEILTLTAQHDLHGPVTNTLIVKLVRVK
jgi:hypothetical protein